MSGLRTLEPQAASVRPVESLRRRAPAPRHRWRRAALVAASMLALSTLFGLAAADRWMPGWDSAVYLELAESIASGRGYAYEGFSYSKLPPGMPLLLAGIRTVAGGSWLVLRLAVAAFAAAAVTLAFLHLRRRDSRPVAAAGAALFALSAPLWQALPFVQADLPFLAVGIAEILAADHHLRTGRRPSLVLACALACAATTFRLSGAVSGIGAAVVLLMRGRRRAAAALSACALLFPVLWLLAGQAPARPLPADLPEASGYLRELVAADHRACDSASVSAEGFALRAAANLAHLAATVASSFAGGRDLPPWAWVPIATLVLAGCVLSLRRGGSVAEVCVLAHVALHAAWPAWEPRYALPLLPFAGWWAWIALRAARVPPRAIAALAAVALCASLASAARVIRDEHAAPYFKGRQADELATIAWMRDALPADAVVVADRAPWCPVLAERTSFGFARSADPRRVLATLREVGATHLFVNDREDCRRWLLPLVRSRPDLFREVHRLRDQAVYEVR